MMPPIQELEVDLIGGVDRGGVVLPPRHNTCTAHTPGSDHTSRNLMSVARAMLSNGYAACQPLSNCGTGARAQADLKIHKLTTVKTPADSIYIAHCNFSHHCNTSPSSHPNHCTIFSAIWVLILRLLDKHHNSSQGLGRVFKKKGE